jgi:hypothetical protein
VEEAHHRRREVDVRAAALGERAQEDGAQLANVRRERMRQQSLDEAR